MRSSRCQPCSWCTDSRKRRHCPLRTCQRHTRHTAAAKRRPSKVRTCQPCSWCRWMDSMRLLQPSRCPRRTQHTGSTRRRRWKVRKIPPRTSSIGSTRRRRCRGRTCRASTQYTLRTTSTPTGYCRCPGCSWCSSFAPWRGCTCQPSSWCTGSGPTRPTPHQTFPRGSPSTGSPRRPRLSDCTCRPCSWCRLRDSKRQLRSSRCPRSS